MSRLKNLDLLRVLSGLFCLFLLSSWVLGDHVVLCGFDGRLRLFSFLFFLVALSFRLACAR